MRPKVLQFIGVVCLVLISASVAGVFSDGLGSIWNWRDCWVVLFLSVVLGLSAMQTGVRLVPLSIALLVARSPVLGTSAGGVGVLLAALAAAVLAVLSARIGRPAGKA